MSDRNTKFIRKYIRKSKSKWSEEDDSTILLLADYTQDNCGDIDLSFNRYIYLHRDEVGRILGISISKKMLDDNPEFDSRYLDEIDMYGFLLMHIDEVTAFCELYTDDFEAIFGIPPSDYFEAAEIRWFSIIRDV